MMFFKKRRAALKAKKDLETRRQIKEIAEIQSATIQLKTVATQLKDTNEQLATRIDLLRQSKY